jgi:hypothetical protein
MSSEEAVTCSSLLSFVCMDVNLENNKITVNFQQSGTTGTKVVPGHQEAH